MDTVTEIPIPQSLQNLLNKRQRTKVDRTKQEVKEAQ